MQIENIFSALLHVTLGTLGGYALIWLRGHKQANAKIYLVYLLFLSAFMLVVVFIAQLYKLPTITEQEKFIGSGLIVVSFFVSIYFFNSKKS